MKKQNGITLIALIITIIVMLILVGVTINVALNGGLFSTTDDATRKTEKHSTYDQIVGAMKLTDNGNIKVKGTYDEIVKIFGDDKVEATNPESVDENTKEVTFEVRGKRGIYKYKITGTEIIIDPVEQPEEDQIITAIMAYKEQSALIMLDPESYDSEKECYRVKDNVTGLENLQNVEIYLGMGFALIHDPNTNKDYILLLDRSSNVLGIILQPEEKTITIREGIVALSNLEEFYLGELKDGYWFGGLEPVIGKPIDTGDFIIHNQGFENNAINAIILSDTEFFNGLDDSMSINSIVVDYLYVPVGFEETIWADMPEDRQFTFGGRDADDVDSLNKVTIDGQEYYELHWSELKDEK